eukprot:SAG31_NODE_101_length_25195_cov_67.436758_4_plen_141_part_00
MHVTRELVAAKPLQGLGKVSRQDGIEMLQIYRRHKRGQTIRLLLEQSIQLSVDPVWIATALSNMCTLPLNASDESIAPGRMFELEGAMRFCVVVIAAATASLPTILIASSIGCRQPRFTSQSGHQTTLRDNTKLPKFNLG